MTQLWCRGNRVQPPTILSKCCGKKTQTSPFFMSNFCMSSFFLLISEKIGMGLMGCPFSTIIGTVYHGLPKPHHGGTCQSSLFIGFSIVNSIHLGEPLHCRKPPYCELDVSMFTSVFLVKQMPHTS